MQFWTLVTESHPKYVLLLSCCMGRWIMDWGSNTVSTSCFSQLAQTSSMRLYYFGIYPRPQVLNPKWLS